VDTCTGLTPNATNAQVTCHGTLLPAYNHVDLYLELDVPETRAIHASATVSTADVDPNPQNDTATVDTLVSTPARLAVSLTTDKTTAVFGERVTQTVTVTNSGPFTATEVVVDLTLLPGSAIDAIKGSRFSSCSGTTAVRCTAASLENGGSLTATFSYLAPQKLGSCQTRADASWSTVGYGGGGASAEVYVQVVAPPPSSDLSVAMDTTPNTLSIGDSVTYTITATNRGGSPASNVTAELDLPSSLVFVSASPQCSGGPLVTCSAGTLNSSTAATFTVTARAVEPGTVTTTASVSTTSEESNSGNNTAAATIVVNAPPPPPTRRRAARH
jgi:uncharacterized repeat protein (TIGR01451 family)